MGASTPSAGTELGVRSGRGRDDHGSPVVTLPWSTGRLRATIGQLVKWSTGGSLHEGVRHEGRRARCGAQTGAGPRLRPRPRRVAPPGGRDPLRARPLRPTRRVPADVARGGGRTRRSGAAGTGARARHVRGAREDHPGTRLDRADHDGTSGRGGLVEPPAGVHHRPGRAPGWDADYVSRPPPRSCTWRGCAWSTAPRWPSSTCTSGPIWFRPCPPRSWRPVTCTNTCGNSTAYTSRRRSRRSSRPSSRGPRPNSSTSPNSPRPCSLSASPRTRRAGRSSTSTRSTAATATASSPGSPSAPRSRRPRPPSATTPASPGRLRPPRHDRVVHAGDIQSAS